jgi:hypothetical protein
MFEQKKNWKSGERRFFHIKKYYILFLYKRKEDKKFKSILRKQRSEIIRLKLTLKNSQSEKTLLSLFDCC